MNNVSSLNHAPTLSSVYESRHSAPCCVIKCRRDGVIRLRFLRHDTHTDVYIRDGTVLETHAREFKRLQKLPSVHPCTDRIDVCTRFSRLILAPKSREVGAQTRCIM